MTEGIIFSICCCLVISGVIGGIIGSAWNDDGKGFICGLFLGPIGWIVITQLPHIKRNQPIPVLITETCVKCHEVLDFTELSPGAYKCPFCMHGFTLDRQKTITIDPYDDPVAPVEEIITQKIVIKCPRCQSDLEIIKGTKGDCECSECTHVFKLG